VEPSSSRLEDLGYANRARDLVRFIEDPLDDAIGRVAREAFEMGSRQREALRRSIGEREAYTLLLFAKRRSVSALRMANTYALQAIQGLTLITRDTIDFRDLSVDFPLYAARELGADMRTLVPNAVTMSEPGVAGSFSARATMIPTMTLQSCALMEVESSYGMGYMSTRDGDYKPSADVAGCAVRLADEIDAEGTYAVNELHTSSLPSVWFGDVRRRDQPATGCVGFSAILRAESTGRGHGLLVFLAELPPTALCSELAARAAATSTPDRPQVAAAHGRWMALVIGGSHVQGQAPVETAASLARFETAARALLHRFAHT
jgi:hypothetical protein